MSIKRIMLSGLLLALAATPGLSQNKGWDQESNKAGVSVVKAGWKGASCGSRCNVDHFTIHIKNTGTKAITAINWDYLLVDSVRGNKLCDHLQFRTDDKRIKPGETKKLSKQIKYHSTPDYVRGMVKIMRVEYEDGSVWVRPA